MAAHDGKQHSETQQGSLMDEPAFIELSRIARRLAPLQRNQLSDWLMEERLKELSDELDRDIRIFDDGENPFGFTPADDY
jgi:hypothetical protein